MKNYQRKTTYMKCRTKTQERETTKTRKHIQQNTRKKHQKNKKQTQTKSWKNTRVPLELAKSEPDKYPNDPRNCRHPNGLRGYGAAGEKISICDMCGMRWLRGTGRDPGMIQCQPKAAPTAKTPLFKKGSDMDKIIAGRRADRLSASSSSGSSRPSWLPHASSMLAPEVDPSVRSSRPKSKAAAKSQGAPPIAPTSKPKLAGMSEQEIIEMQAELEYMRRQGAQQGSHMDVEEENWDDWDEEDPQAWFHREQDFPAGYEVPPVPEQGSEEEFWVRAFQQTIPWWRRILEPSRWNLALRRGSLATADRFERLSSGKPKCTRLMWERCEPWEDSRMMWWKCLQEWQI